MIKTIEKFYKAFQNVDAEEMVSCYHDEVEFEDPAFGLLKGEQAKNMWRMLCASQKGTDFLVEFSDVKTDGDSGSAHWEAFYTFSKTGRQVHNKIDAHFEFKDGLIIRHRDDFNLHAWAKQALGLKGWLLGGTVFFQKGLQKQTGAMLSRFSANNK